MVEPELRCGVCGRCTKRRRRVSKPACPSIATAGSLPPNPRALGRSSRISLSGSSARLHVVSDDISAELATFVHPLAAGYTWAVELADLKPGETVMVLGPGPRGLACVVAAMAPAPSGWESPVSMSTTTG